MKQILIAVGIIAIIIIGFLAFRNTDDSALRPALNGPAGIETPDDNKIISDNEDIKVIYDGTSFSPKTLTVKNNTKVTFTNNSTGKMWVASGPHPAHTDYPEFDAKKAMEPGQSYTFTFTKTGNWKFHNHLNPAANGSITVE